MLLRLIPNLGLVLLLSQVARADNRSSASPTELAAQLDQVQGQLKIAEDSVRLVETQYTQRGETTNEEFMLQRFSDGEIQYLLGNFAGASVLFYDLVSDEHFRAGPKYSDALYFLADALYQQKNFIGSQVYLRELVAKGAASGHYREALTRYLETSGKLNQYVGIDQYIQEARSLSGALSPELAYVYAKWLFRRTDIPDEQRLSRAREAFAPIAEDVNNGYHLQAAYFLGVIEVERATSGNYSAAIEQFQKVLQAPARETKDAQVKEIANLSLGRLYYEMGKYQEAVDRYQEIPRESENFPDSLYEIAWAQVRKQDWQRAKNATEILLEVAEDSTLDPEARILQGHLLLKLQKYSDATDTYNQVINKYGPVYEEFNALIKLHPDPVAYFNDLLAHNERNLDIASLLPPVATKYMNTQNEVGAAVQMASDIEAGRHGVDESQGIASHLLRTLDERGMEAFPLIQAGYTKADSVETSLTQSEQALVRVEGALVDTQISAQDRADYQRLAAELDALQHRLATLPKTQDEVAGRKKRMQDKVDAIDKEAFRLGYEIQSQYASLAAMEKWLDDTRAQRHGRAEDEKAFAEELRQGRETLDVHQRDLVELRKVLQVERSAADADIAGEESLRKQYNELLSKQHALIAPAEAMLGPNGAQLVTRAHQVRQQLDAVRQRVQAAKEVLHQQLLTKGAQIRQKIESEQSLLNGYGGDVNVISADARNLVGQIAFDSFKRVRRQFYELVLKADVGLVDVAFTRKQDKTTEIQKISSQKDRELRALDEEFKEVLKDVD